MPNRGHENRSGMGNGCKRVQVDLSCNGGDDSYDDDMERGRRSRKEGERKLLAKESQKEKM